MDKEEADVSQAQLMWRSRHSCSVNMWGVLLMSVLPLWLAGRDFVAWSQMLATSCGLLVEIEKTLFAAFAIELLLK